MWPVWRRLLALRARRSQPARWCVRVTATEPADFQEVPAPRGLPLVGTTLALLAAGAAPQLHRYIDGRHKQLGPVFRERIGPVSGVFVADPLLMRQVFQHEGKHPKHMLPDAWLLYNKIYGCSRGLFFMDDEEWLYYRRILNKFMLKSDASQWMVEPCNTVATEMIRRWSSLLRDSRCATISNLEEQFYRFSIDTVIAILLGAKYGECKHLLEHELDQLSSMVHLIFKTSAKISLIPAQLAATLRLSAWTNFVKSVDDGLDMAGRITEKILAECPEGDGLLAKMKAESVTKELITRIVADLILAAGDTTAYSMQWTIYLLSKHKDVQDKLVKTNGDKTAYNNLVRGVIKESLRLYPIAPFITRILQQDTIIGGYLMPKGTLIVMSLYTSSREPKYFMDPDKFWPERWTRNGSEYVAASQYASLPFAMGARSCIGRKLAETQMQIVLTKLTSSFNMELMNEGDVEMVLSMVSVPAKPIVIQISKRD